LIECCYYILLNYFAPELGFDFHCEEQTNKAYSELGLINRNFNQEKTYLSLCT